MNQTTTRARSGLTKAQTRATLSSFNWNLGFRAVFDATCAGTTFIFVSFALSLGLAEERMGLITAVVSGACMLQILGLAMSGMVRDKKRFVLTLALIEPTLMIAAVLTVPFLPEHVRIYALAVAAFTAAGALHLTRPVADDWVASSIPAGLRGRFLGRRLQVLTVVVLFTILVLGVVGDRIDRSNSFGLAMILAVGGLFGLLAVAPLRRATLPEASATARVRWHDVPRVFHDRAFRRFLLGTMIYYVPFFLAVAYHQVFNLQVLGLSKTVIAFVSVGYMVVKVLALPLVGRRAARWGPRRMMACAALIYMVFFILFPFSAAAGVWAVALGWALAGLADAATNVAWVSAQYGAIPQSSTRPAYFAVTNLMVLMGYAIGPLISVQVLQSLRDVRIDLGWVVLEHFHIFYAMCGMLMIPCMMGAWLFIGRPVKAARPATDRFTPPGSPPGLPRGSSVAAKPMPASR